MTKSANGASMAPYVSTCAKTQRIRELNDTLRAQLLGGRIMFSTGVQALGRERVRRLMLSIIAFNEFDNANDPHGEHDFGAVSEGDQRVFWKIDYYDRQLEFGSPDPSDPAVTIRVLTVMLAEEY